MPQVIFSLLVMFLFVVTFMWYFTKTHDKLMVDACRMYTHSKLKSEAIMDYVSAAWKIFPYLLFSVGFSSFVVTLVLVS